MRLIYLGSPYNDQDPQVRILRRGASSAVLAYFAHTAPGLCLHSSIVHWGPVADLFDLPHDFDFWKEQDFFFIRKSSAMWVLPLVGWRESYGLNLEIEYAEDIGREILYVQLAHEGGFLLKESKKDMIDLQPRDVFQASPHWPQNGGEKSPDPTPDDSENVR